MPIKNWDKYPTNWATEIRPRILKREGHCCKICKVPNYTWVCRGKWDGVEVWQDDDGAIYQLDNGIYISSDYVGEVWSGTPGKQVLVKIVLTVAHLDHDITNNTDENLAALCQLHHLRHDAELHRNNARKTVKKKKGLQNLFDNTND